MISNQEKAVIHIYKHAAGLSDASYRQHIREAAGVASSSDPAMDHSGFTSLMVLLEISLWSRVRSGNIPDPRPHRYITSETYWRDQQRPKSNSSAQQGYAVKGLWIALQNWINPDNRTDAYLAAIIAKATQGRATSPDTLSKSDASKVIDALRGRIRQATHAFQSSSSTQ